MVAKSECRVVPADKAHLLAAGFGSPPYYCLILTTVTTSLTVHIVASQVLQLKDVRYELIGDEEARGLSGGQRKRVNVGVEVWSSFPGGEGGRKGSRPVFCCATAVDSNATWKQNL